MFLTITIDTAQQKKSKVRMVKKGMFITKGWRAKNISTRPSAVVAKKSFWQRVSSWKKKIGGGIYKLGDQTALF
ncbi:MAG: hypothetical protein WC285_02355 [Candidatus Gracilibacteria bacterium]|jgi:hypothetical protein